MPRPALRQTLLACAFFAAATVLFTWPIAAHVGDGLGDVWDAKLNAWIFHWDYHQTFHDPAHLFDANIFYPARYALAFSENLYGASLFGFPLYAAGVSTLAAYNVLFLLGMFLSAMAAWLLARDLTGDPVCSLLAGIVYAFVPWRIAQIPHVQFQWGPFLALMLLFLLRFLDHGRRRDLILMAVFFAWNALTNVHYAMFSGFLLAVVLAYRSLAEGRPVLLRSGGVLAAVAVTSVLLVPFFLPYVRASQLYGMHRGDDEIRVFSGRPVDLLTAGPQNKIYAPLTQRWAQPEGDFFPGLSVAALAVAALLRRRVPASPEEGRDAGGRGGRFVRILDVIAAALALIWLAARVRPGLVVGPLHLRDPGRILVFPTVLVLTRLVIAFPRRSRYRNLGDFSRRMPAGPKAGLLAAIAATGLVIAFGMRTPFYRFLVQSSGPVFRSIRVPSRGIVLFDLGVGVLASLALSEWSKRLAGRGRRVLLAVVFAAVVLEYRAFPVDVAHVEAANPPVDLWLAGIANVPVVEWPLATESEVEHQFRSTAHWKPLLNGYSGFGPPHYGELGAVVNRKPMPEEAWDRMARLGARILVFHPHELVGDDRLAYVRGALAGVRSGRAHPVRLVDHGKEKDGVFSLGAPAVASDPGAEQAVRLWLERQIQEASPPFGVLDSPREFEVVRPAQWAFGWALDDSGVAEVLISVDGAPAVPAVIGLEHPGVSAAYPNYPENDRAGYGFSVPPLPPGEHDLTVTIRAKDGGVAEFQRRIRTR